MVFVYFGDTGGRADIRALAAVDADGMAAGLGQRIGTMHTDGLGADLLAHAAFDAAALLPADGRVVRFDGNTDSQWQMLAHGGTSSG